MAERRALPFPVHGSRVVANDGSTWTFLRNEMGPDIPVHGPGWWEQGDPGLSEEEQRLSREMERRELDALLLALRVWERALEACSFVKTDGPSYRATDPLPMFVELQARANMQDHIMTTCDGAPPKVDGMRTPAEHTALQIAALVGISLGRRVASMLHRQRVAARTAMAAAKRTPG